MLSLPNSKNFLPALQPAILLHRPIVQDYVDHPAVIVSPNASSNPSETTFFRLRDIDDAVDDLCGERPAGKCTGVDAPSGVPTEATLPCDWLSSLQPTRCQQSIGFQSP